MQDHHSHFGRRALAVRLLAIASVAAAGLSVASPAAAQAFPVKPLTIVVPFAAGGATDILARIVAQHPGCGTRPGGRH